MQVQAQNINKAADLKWKYEITDTMNIYSPWDVAAGQNKYIFLSDRYSKSIYRFDIAAKKFIQLGRKGAGPGEYKFPNNLSVYGDKLYYSDYYLRNIQSMNFDGKYAVKIDSKISSEFWSPFAVYKPDKAFIGRTSSNQYWIYDSVGKGYLKIEECFRKMPGLVAGGSLVYHNGMIYYVNPFELILHSINPLNASVNSVELSGINKIFSWKSYYSKKITEAEYKDLDTYKWIVKPSRMFKIIKDGKLFLGISYVNTRTKVNYLVVFNDKGKCLLTVDLNSLVLFDIENGVLKLYRQDKEELKGFYFYSLKKESWNAIK